MKKAIRKAQEERLLSEELFDNEGNTIYYQAFSDFQFTDQEYNFSEEDNWARDRKRVVKTEEETESEEKMSVESLIPKCMPTEQLAQKYNALEDDSEPLEIQQMVMDRAIEEIRIDAPDDSEPNVDCSQYMLMQDLPKVTYRMLLAQEGT